MSLRRMTVVGLLVLAAIAAAIFVWPRIAGQPHANTAKGPAAVPVSTAKVAVKNVPVRLSAVGNVSK